MFKSRLFAVAAAVAMVVASSGVRAGVYITEWAYSAGTGEYVELTNTGPGAVDFTGWSYDDDSRTAGSFDLSGFGLVQAEQSVVFTESDAAAFTAAWNLSPSVLVLGGNANNLGRNDEINIYDGSSNLVDRLTFGDQSFPGSPRTQNVGGNIPWAALGLNDPTLAVLSAVGDGYGSFTSTAGDVGNPGTYVVPEPACLGLLGLVLAAGRRRRRA